MTQKFLLIFLFFFSVQSSEPALRFAGFWTFTGYRREVTVTVQFGQLTVKIHGVGTKTYDVERVGIGNLVFFRINPLYRSFNSNVDVHFFLASNSDESYSLIASSSCVKEQIPVYMVDNRRHQYTENINIGQLRTTFCSHVDNNEQLISTFSITGVDKFTELSQPLYIITGKLTVKPVGECTGVFVLIRSTGEVFPIGPMTGCGNLGTSADFFVARYTKNQDTLPTSLFFDIRSVSMGSGFTLIMHPSFCQRLHEADIPQIFPSTMSHFSRFLQPRPVVNYESAQTIHDMLETEYQNSLIPDKTYEMFMAATEPEVHRAKLQIPSDPSFNPSAVDPSPPDNDDANVQSIDSSDLSFNPSAVDPSPPDNDDANVQSIDSSDPSYKKIKE